MTRVLSRALVSAGHDVRVVGVYPRDYPAADYEEDSGVRVWRLREPASPGGWIAGRLRLLARIAGWSRRGSVELVEVPDYAGWAAGWPRLRAPVVARLNGSTAYFARELGQAVRRITYRLERASLARANFWCSSSEYTALKTREVFGMDPGSVRILYNPVDEPDGHAVSRSRNEVLFSGTLTAKKGVISLIEAWPRVVDASPEARLHVYGKDGVAENGGSMRADLTSRIPERVRASVFFHGHVERGVLQRALQSARVAVFPSYAEAFAIAPLEAMSAGCPTVYSRRGSGPELIRDGTDGILTDPDRPSEIADAIVRLLSDDALANRLGEAGRARVRDRFSVSKLLPENEDFYARCISGSG